MLKDGPYLESMNKSNTYESMLGDFENLLGDSNFVRICGRQLDPLPKQLQGKDQWTHYPNDLCIIPWKIIEMNSTTPSSFSVLWTRLMLLLILILDHKLWIQQSLRPLTRIYQILFSCSHLLNYFTSHTHFKIKENIFPLHHIFKIIP